MKINWSELGIANNQITLAKFGSLVNGFAVASSDMDLAIITNSYVNERQFLKLLAAILRNKLDLEKFSIEAVTNDKIRIPLITLKIKDSNPIDLIINNVLGVINAQLLYVYSQIDQRVEQLGKLVKLWAKAWDVSSKQNLSSYAITLMVIYYLQQKGVVPVIQELSLFKNQEIKIKRIVKQNELEEFSTNVEFETDLSVIRKQLFEMKIQNYEQYEHAQTATLYELFLEFLKFYKQDGFFLTNHLQVDISSSKRNFVGTNEAVNYLYSIIDPFDKMHNPGDKVKKDDRQNDSKITEIFYAFSQSIEYLESSNIDNLIRVFPKKNR